MMDIGNNVVSLENRSKEKMDDLIAKLASDVGCSFEEAREKMEEVAQIVMARPENIVQIDADAGIALDVLIEFADGIAAGLNPDDSGVELARKRLAWQALAHGVPDGDLYAEMVATFIAKTAGQGPAADRKAFLRGKEKTIWAKHCDKPKPRTPNKSGRRTKRR